MSKPTDCDTALNWLCDALDHAPFAVPQSEIEEHLTTCKSCYAKAARLIADDVMLKELGQNGSAIADEELIVSALKERFKTLPLLCPGNRYDCNLSDQDLQWLAAAGTPLPSWMMLPHEKK